jgi:hypothetical protein
MYLRSILCTLYGAVDFYCFEEKGCMGGVGEMYVKLLYVLLGEGGDEHVRNDTCPPPHPPHGNVK